jgi:UDP-glucose 4-epimerase
VTDVDLAGVNVLVTGGAGFIGSHLVDRIGAERPAKVVVVDNLFLGRQENLAGARKSLGDRLRLYIRDASIPSVMEQIITDEQIQIVFDLATIPLPASYGQPRWTFENNIGIVMCLLELLRKGKFGMYVHCSSSEAYGTAQFVPMTEAHPLNPTTTYGASKAAQDLLIQAYDRMYDLPFFIFRPFNNFGERQNDQAYAGVIPMTIKRIEAGLPPIQHGDGTQTRDFIYVKDTVDAIVKLTKAGYRKGIVNVCRGREVSVADLLRIIAQVMGWKGEIVQVPNPRPTDVARHFADNARLRSIIPDFQPTDLEEAIGHVVDWYAGKAT